jgi:hypothetical protein
VEYAKYDGNVRKIYLYALWSGLRCHYLFPFISFSVNRYVWFHTSDFRRFSTEYIWLINEECLVHFIVSVAYFTTPSVAIQYSIEWYGDELNNELRGISKEVVVAQLRYHSRMSL